MWRFFAVLLAAVVGIQAGAPYSLAAELAPIDLRVISGVLDCCERAGPCQTISREVGALAETDGECMKFELSNPVVVELLFETSAQPGPFLLRITPADDWQRAVSFLNWQEGRFDEVLLSPSPGAGSSLSALVTGDHVDVDSGQIVLRLASKVRIDVGDEKTLDEVEIVIPPPE